MRVPSQVQILQRHLQKPGSGGDKAIAVLNIRQRPEQPLCVRVACAVEDILAYEEGTGVTLGGGDNE